MSYNDYLAHHGIKGMKWGKMQGPPYPLTDEQRSDTENRLNPTSPSARALKAQGINSRFNTGAATKSYNVTDSGTGGKSSSSERKSNLNYHDTLTREKRMEMLKAQNPDKYGKTPQFTSKQEETKETKKTTSKKSTEKTEAQKAKEAEKARKEALNKWYKDGKEAVDDAFNEETNSRTFADLLEKFYKGAFDKGFDGKADAELEKKYDEEGNEIERTEGEKFYEKIMSRIDKNSKHYKEFKERYDEIMNDSELTSMKRLSKSISLLADYAYTLDESSSNSDSNRTYAKILNYLDNRLKRYSEKMTYSSKSKLNMDKVTNHEAIEEYLKKHGF